MINKHAHELAVAAAAYLDTFGDTLGCAKDDHEALMSIAWMIENDEKETEIWKAMRKLDTACRDIIPDSVYYHYNKNNKLAEFN